MGCKDFVLPENWSKTALNLTQRLLNFCQKDHETVEEQIISLSLEFLFFCEDTKDLRGTFPTSVVNSWGLFLMLIQFICRKLCTVESSVVENFIQCELLPYYIDFVEGAMSLLGDS